MKIYLRKFYCRLKMPLKGWIKSNLLIVAKSIFMRLKFHKGKISSNLVLRNITINTTKEVQKTLNQYFQNKSTFKRFLREKILVSPQYLQKIRARFSWIGKVDMVNTKFQFRLDKNLVWTNGERINCLQPNVMKIR
jgi:hypothetical protein